MQPLWKTGLIVVALLSTVSQSALARSPYNGQNPNTVLITPSGEVLDFVPEQGSVMISRDRMGRTVLIDRSGNLIATEMPADMVYGRADRNRYPNDYYPPAPSGGGYDDEDMATGGIPEDQPVERQPLGQGYPQNVNHDPSVSDDALARPASPSTAAPSTLGSSGKAKPEITALQVFLAREGFSPGAIDGHMGMNVQKALEAWQQKTGETLNPNDTDAIMERLRMNGGLPFTSYTLTAADAAGPYVAEIPEDYSQKAAMPSLGYTSTTEMLAEKFHMDEGYLKALNPGVDFTVPGSTVKVVSIGQPHSGRVARIVADKGRKQVLAYGEDGQLITAYPASIGSNDTPSPSGTVQVQRVAFDPGYTYNPKVNFQQGANDKVLNIPPGPNGPVGTVWIALSKPTYGIHGTPEPSKIGRTQSHGCIRLTNWDATELAKMVQPGVTVEFVD
ncbi:L,D-transpeptidase [Agrobacterium vitis]|uniref:L,D-transpeptidase family protein n=1 Tax=Agrobacterium vitis TaxID=373 RepID=UPI00307F71A5